MLSYSGLTNYGKSSFPSVSGWNGSLNIKREPRKAIYTKRLERVGDTNDVMNQLAHDDRVEEHINRFARGTNPMVSVSYGECQTENQTSKRGAAFLPYRIMEGGAFRPPIKRQEDLLPLSRLPRKWTTVDTLPTSTDHTKRLINIGTAESTTQVKNSLNNVSYETTKLISKEAEIVPPLIEGQTKDLITAKAFTNASDHKEVIVVRPSYDRMNNILKKFSTTLEYIPSYDPIVERPSYDRMNNILKKFSTTLEYIPSYDPIVERPSYDRMNNLLDINVSTNVLNQKEVISKRPSYDRMNNLLQTFSTALEYNPSYEPISKRPNIKLQDSLIVKGSTNPLIQSEKPSVPDTKIVLLNNLPLTKIHTNINKTNSEKFMTSKFERLPKRLQPGKFEGRPIIPQNIEREIPILKR